MSKPTILEVPLSNIQNSLFSLRPDQKNKSVSGNGSEILGRGRHTYFFLKFFFWKKYNFMHFERHLPFRMHYIIFFPESLKKSRFRQ